MKLHTDKLTMADLFDAARVARVEFSRVDRKGSRSRDHGFDFTLTGESRRRPNAGTGSGEHIGPDDYAATWDQWGVFLAVLFDRDPNASGWAYDGIGEFHDRTAGRFHRRAVSADALAESIERTGKIYDGLTYWPADAHGDHTFRFSGTPFQQECTKCTARQIWGPR